MSSVVDICNIALFRIGNSMRIDDITENSKPAEACNQFYDNCRDFVLRDACNWGFATAFVKLAEVVTNPDPEYPHAYALPTDCMRVRRIVSPARVAAGGFPSQGMPQVSDTPYRIINGGSQRLISTVVAEATLEYTVKVENSEMFDPVFVSALAWRLASQIAAPLAKDAGIAGGCAAQYEAEIRAAAAAALNEGTTSYPRESSFITGRDT